MTEHLFSYGTLQMAAVQEANFGRALPMNPDALPGFRVETVTIIDPDVIETNGSDQHPILRRSTNVSDVVDGSVLELTSVEQRAADAYEVDDYRRIEVTLASGRRAWVYVADEIRA
jgi:hypothetical protein